MRRRALGLCRPSWTICRVIANVAAAAPRSSPGPAPLLLAAQTRGGRAELRVIDRGPGVREAGAAVTILIGKLAELAEAQASSQRVEAALRRVAKLVARGAPPAE